ncbi:MAG: Fic family protein [Bacteroidales bacterium]|nr:Fic family protein [Bacteroidales bacterium]
MANNKENTPQVSEIEELRQKINALKGTADESIKYINSELESTFVYNCNALGGNKTSKETTKRIIKNGVQDGEKIELRHILEITGLSEAYKKMQELAKNEKIQESDIEDLHKTLHSKIDPETAGILQSSSDKINMGKEMRDFIFWFNTNDLDAISFATEAYVRYIFLHPYKGSNGRMARLIMNLAFLRRNFSTVIIPNKWRKEYEKLINEYDEEEFTNFIKRCIYFSQNLVVNKQGNLYSENKKRHIRGLNVEDDVMEYVKENPGSKAVIVKQAFPKISFTKLQRIFRTLAQAGKIEFRGPTKTGGYFAINE